MKTTTASEWMQLKICIIMQFAMFDINHKKKYWRQKQFFQVKITKGHQEKEIDAATVAKTILNLSLGYFFPDIDSFVFAKNSTRHTCHCTQKEA